MEGCGVSSVLTNTSCGDEHMLPSHPPWLKLTVTEVDGNAQTAIGSERANLEDSFLDRRPSVMTSLGSGR